MPFLRTKRRTEKRKEKKRKRKKEKNTVRLEVWLVGKLNVAGSVASSEAYNIAVNAANSGYISVAGSANICVA